MLAELLLAAQPVAHVDWLRKRGPMMIATTEDINDGAVSQRGISGDGGPLTRNSNSNVHTASITAAHAGELVVRWAWIEDSTGITGGSYGSGLFVEDSTGIVNPTSEATITQITSGISLMIWTLRVQVAAGLVEATLDVTDWLATGSVVYSDIQASLSLLKR